MLPSITAAARQDTGRLWRMRSSVLHADNFMSYIILLVLSIFHLARLSAFLIARQSLTANIEASKMHQEYDGHQAARHGGGSELVSRHRGLVILWPENRWAIEDEISRAMRRKHARASRAYLLQRSSALFEIAAEAEHHRPTPGEASSQWAMWWR